MILIINHIVRYFRGENRLTVLHEILPITLIGRVVGVFPFKIMKDPAGNQVFVTSRGMAVYTIILLVLSFVHLIYLPQMTIAAGNFVNGVESSRNYSVGDFLQNPLTTPPLLIRFINGVAMSMMGMSSKINTLLFVRRALPEALTSLSLTDNLLGVRLKDRKNNIRAIWIFVGFSILVGLPGQIYSAIFTSSAKSYFIGIYALLNNLNNLTAVSAEVQFLAVCYILKSRFDLINRKLIDLLDPRPQFDTKNMAALRREFLKRDNAIAHHENHEHSKMPVLQTIQSLKLAHLRLCDFLDRANDMFQILSSISGCFLNQLFNMYSFFVGGAWKLDRFDNAEVADIADSRLLTHPLNNLSWGIYYGARFIAITTIASKTTDSAKKPLAHILRLRQSCKDSATKEKLILFFDHLTSRKVIFSAAGFFNLDIALISSVRDKIIKSPATLKGGCWKIDDLRLRSTVIVCLSIYCWIFFVLLV